MADSKSYGSDSAKDKKHIKLTDEEKAVLLECRRNSLARGIPLGIISVLGLRYFVKQGLVPPHVTRWSIFYYSGTFFLTCMMGVGSYRQKCMEKIMSLDNSFLADQVRQHMQQGGVRGPNDYGFQSEKRDQFKLSSSDKSYKGNPKDSYIASTNSGTSNEQEYDDQPIAFGGTSNTSTSNVYDSDSVITKKGRTFDEIREENRKQQLQRNFPRSTIKHDSVDTPTTGNKQLKAVKRNKYGDIIYEE